MQRVEGLDHVALTVRDVARSVEWYARVLGLERRHEDAWGDFPAIVGAGTTALALFPASAPDPKPQATGREHLAMRHIAFRVDRRGFEAMQAHLSTLGIPFTDQDHQVSWSIYFHDPDGYEIEVTTYESAGRV
jgi:catechol 2,3-dioxygenase-like lactoylglutathione lyase family enzyme